MIARLKPDASANAATQEIDALQHRIRMQYPGAAVATGAAYRTINDSLAWRVRTPLYILLAAVGCLFLIACLNFSGLLIARASTRRKEIAIRAALGNSTWGIFNAQIRESLLICITSGSLGLFSALLTTHWLATRWQNMPRVDAVQVDGSVVLFAIILTFAAGILAALLPGLSASSHAMFTTLQDASHAVGRGVGRVRLRKFILSAEIALTVVLLIAAGLLFKSFLYLRSVNVGCVSQHTTVLQYSLTGSGYSRPEQVVAFHTKLLELVRHLPGVESAGLTNVVPGGGYGGDINFTIPERPTLSSGAQTFALMRTADPGYFATMQIPLVRGRWFGEDERLHNDRYVIVDQLFASTFLQGVNPIGKHVHVDWNVGPEDHEIIGVVGNTLYSLDKDARPTMYFPILSGSHGIEENVTLAVRSASDDRVIGLTVKRLMAGLEPTLPVYKIRTMDQIIDSAPETRELTLRFCWHFR